MASVLLVVDAQKDMPLPPEPVPAADAVVTALRDALDQARKSGSRVVHIRNNGGEADPDKPGTPGWELVFEVHEGELAVAGVEVAPLDKVEFA